MSVTIIERTTGAGNHYWYVEEKGKRIAQCKRRRDAERVKRAMDVLIIGEEDDAARRAEERIREERADAQQQGFDEVEAARESGIVVAKRLP